MQAALQGRPRLPRPEARLEKAGGVQVLQHYRRLVAEAARKKQKMADDKTVRKPVFQTIENDSELNHSSQENLPGNQSSQYQGTSAVSL